MSFKWPDHQITSRDFFSGKIAALIVSLQLLQIETVGFVVEGDL